MLSLRSTDANLIPRARQFLGLRIAHPALREATDLVLHAVAEKRRLTITFLNPNIVVATRRNAALVAAINSFDTALADGIGVVHGARMLGINVQERISTDSLCLDLFRQCAASCIPLRVYLLGALPGVAVKAARNLQEAFFPVTVAGADHGWFEDAQSHAMVQRINAAAADLLLVCLGTPRQQLWVQKHALDLNCPVIMTGGGYLNNLSVNATGFYPPWIERAKLNWLYRLCTQPGYVWKRYTIEAAIFAGMLLRERCSRDGRGVAARVSHPPSPPDLKFERQK